MTAPKRQRTGDRDKDVTNSVFREAEDRVYRWLLTRGMGSITDARDQRTFYDFILNHAWTLDVKCDQYALNTGNVAWEEWVWKCPRPDDVQKVKGWGLHDGLVYVMYVFPTTEGAWKGLLCSAAKMREAVLDVAGRAPGELREFHKQGTDRDATGYLVPIAFLRNRGCVLEEVDLD